MRFQAIGVLVSWFSPGDRLRLPAPIPKIAKLIIGFIVLLVILQSVLPNLPYRQLWLN